MPITVLHGGGRELGGHFPLRDDTDAAVHVYHADPEQGEAGAESEAQLCFFAPGCSFIVSGVPRAGLERLHEQVDAALRAMTPTVPPPFDDLRGAAA